MCKNFIIFYFDVLIVEDDMILGLKQMLIVSEGGNMVIDITGGKKSMTAAASIFAKDFDFSIVYVDMSTPGSYIPAIHQTRPGSERLNLVYSPLRDLPELFH